MAGEADQNLANGGGGVPLGPGLPPVWAGKGFKMVSCAVHLASDNELQTMTYSECFNKLYNVGDLGLVG